jgi:hypothetical protein
VITRTKSNFFLGKTYFDCVDDAGNCFILYSATIKFFLFKIYYSAFIFSDQQDHITEQSTFHKSTITTEKQLLTFFSRRLKISGNWRATTGSVESQLYSNSNGIVNWDCHHPLAQCNLIYNNHSFSGLGYAETLFLSIKPWHLPIDELRWGRFLAPGMAIIWIQWAGKNPINKIYLNGEEFNDALHSDKTIMFNKGTNQLLFSSISLIRQVKFGDHLARLPLLKLLVNKAMLHSLESKYKAKTTFTDVSGVVHQGWSIFEIVKWEH